MATHPSSAVIQVLRTCRLLEPSQLDEVTTTLSSQFPDAHSLAKELLQRRWLTPYQVNQLLQGRGTDLLMGPYVLLERLGEGASGQVFKARHTSMNRIVALKVLKKDLLTDEEAVGRFYREIEVASQVSHPNIVHAYDAGPSGTTHLLAMEYVEGVDLDRLVRDMGPLPIMQACDYIRQAAVGLQHAHEKGLVHRDIKPSNLLVAKGGGSRSKAEGLKTPLNGPQSGLWTLNQGVVKVLDLGLARLSHPAPNSKTRNLTVLAGGSVMQGTPDYMSPEQAIDFHSADIRTDIYSLGCTFFYLLTGKPPFDGPLAQKLMKHQQAPVPDVAQLRKDLPDGVPPIIQRMMAKRPPDRYQNPGEVADDLSALLATLKPAAPRALTPLPGAPAKKRGSTLRVKSDTRPDSTLFNLPPPKGPPPSRLLVQKPTLRRGRRPPVLVLAIAAVAAVIVLGGAGFFIFRASPEPEPQTHPIVVRPTTAAAVRPTLAALPTEAHPGLQSFLIVQCGKGGGKDQNQLVKTGYGYKLLQGDNFDGWGGSTVKTHCWAHKVEVRFEVNVPPGTPGVLRLWFVDGDDLKRKQKLFVQNKQIGGEYAGFADTGKQVEVNLSAEDTKDGKIEVKLPNLNPAVNAVVSTVEFLPLRTRR